MKKLTLKIIPILSLLLLCFGITTTFAANESVTYQGHVEDYGWMDYVKDGAPAGTTGEAKRVEALRINLTGVSEDSHIVYSPHVEDYGWMDYVQDDQVAGTTGESKRVEAFKIYLTGPVSQTHDVYYRCHVSDFGWLGWAKNDQVAGTSGYAKRMEAIEIRLVPKDQPAPGPTGNPAMEKASIDSHNYGTNDTTGVSTSAYVTTLGWQNPVVNGTTSGTEGQSLPVEAIKAQINNLDGDIIYNTYLRNYGWQTMTGSNQPSGITDSDIHIEALQFGLTGNIANQYNLFYRTHVANIGWMGWAKNGEVAGTSGYDLPVEAFQVVLIPKTAPAPASTSLPAFQEFKGQAVVATPGLRTVQNFLSTALLPVGITNYVWGGGWNEADNAAGPAAVHIGLWPEWKPFFDSNNASYDYNTTKYQINKGLDCSGYVGWVTYNTLNTQDNQAGEVYWADEQALWYASKGYGSFEDVGHVTNLLPGDIISMDSGHVYIVLGVCPDNSVVIAHASPPGVMISGLAPKNGPQNTQARALAHAYMQKYYPEYYTRYYNKMDRDSDSYLGAISKFRWGDNVVSDPDGIRSKSAPEVLNILFNE